MLFLSSFSPFLLSDCWALMAKIMQALRLISPKVCGLQPLINHWKPHLTFSLSPLSLSRELLNLTENNRIFPRTSSMFLYYSFLLAHKISSFPFLKSIPTLSCGHPYWFPCFHSQAPKKDVPFFLQLLCTFRQFLSGFEFPQKQTLGWGFNCK